MKSSDYLISTVKEAPNDAKIISHQLMIRAGLISKLASGLYSYLPIGLKIIQKVEKIIREEIKEKFQIKCGEEISEVISYIEILPNGKKYLAVYNKTGSMINTDKYVVPDEHYFFL